jgi:GDP-L-fucose synthase
MDASGRERTFLTTNSVILVAGASGLIGSACVRHLRTKGYEKILTPTHSELDFQSEIGVQSFFEKQRPDIVVFCAGRVGGILANRDFPADFIVENLKMQVNAITAAHQFGVERFVQFGSSCMYPKAAAQPMDETVLWTGRPEETSLSFATAKLAGVEMSLAYNRQHKVTRFLPIIPNNAYGPNDNFDPASSHLVAGLIQRFHLAKQQGVPLVTLWGTGTPRRELIYSDDIADAIVFLLERETLPDLPLNIGCGVDYSIRELAQAIAKQTGFRGDIEFDAAYPDGSPRKLLDSSRLHALGWQPKVSLEEGLAKTYDWYLANT